MLEKRKSAFSSTFTCIDNSVVYGLDVNCTRLFKQGNGEEVATFDGLLMTKTMLLNQETQETNRIRLKQDNELLNRFCLAVLEIGSGRCCL